MAFKVIAIAAGIGIALGLIVPQQALSAGIAMVKVPALRRAMDKGEIVSASDLASTTVARRRAQGQIVRGNEDILGLAAQRRLSPGQPLRLSDFAEPSTVRKGARVTMMLATSGLRLTAIGSAMESGREGGFIRVMNVETRQVISSRILAPNLVEVLPVGQLALR